MNTQNQDRAIGTARYPDPPALGSIISGTVSLWKRSWLEDSDGAAKTAARLAELASGRSVSVLSARAALARGLVAQHRDETAAAREAFELALRVLADDDWPLLRAELHLRLGRLLTVQDTPAAIAEARAAHLIYDRLGSPEGPRAHGCSTRWACRHRAGTGRRTRRRY